MTRNEILALIDAQEKRDLKLVMEIYSLLKGENLILKPTKAGDHVDLEALIELDGKIIRWNTEIKALNGNYPTHILKEQKRDWVLQRSFGVLAFYAVINVDTKKLYIYNLRLVDWSNCPCVNMEQNICETDPSKGRARYWTYFIPKEMACKTFDLTDEQCKPFLKNK